MPILLFSCSLQSIGQVEREPPLRLAKQCSECISPQRLGISTPIQPINPAVFPQPVMSGVVPPEDIPATERKNLLYHVGDIAGYSLHGQVKWGEKQRVKLRNLSKLTFREYESVVEQLLQMEIASPLQHICWCINCLESPYVLMAYVAREIDNLNCPRCNKRMISSRFIMLDPILEPIIQYHGGLLPLVMGWYFTRRSIPWTADVIIEGNEYADLLFKYKQQLYHIECKITGRNKHERSQETSINYAITQALTHVNFWNSRGVILRQTDIFTNQFDSPTFSTLTNSILQRRSFDIGGNIIKVHPFSLVSTLFENIITNPNFIATNKMEKE